jgi:outer membrane protein
MLFSSGILRARRNWAHLFGSGLVAPALVAAATLVATLGPASAAFAQDAAPVQAPAPMKIGVLDTAKVLKESEEGIRIEANLRKLFDPKKAELAQKEKQLGDEMEAIETEEKQKGRSEALERRKGEFKQKVAMLQQVAMQVNQEYNLKQRDLLVPLLTKVQNIVKALAQREGLDLVFEKQAAVYFRTDLELTERVIQAVNAGDTPKDPKAPKKPAAPKAPAEKAPAEKAPAEKAPPAPKPAAPKPAAPKK